MTPDVEEAVAELVAIVLIGFLVPLILVWALWLHRTGRATP